MNLKLKRLSFDADGIFGTLTDESGNEVAKTLEHSYDSGLGNGSYVPKVSAGTYTCLRHPPNRLPYETFELQNVPPFQGKPVDGILIHIGNYNEDSIGCILVGRNIVPNPDVSHQNMITSSKNTFLKITDLQKGLDSFILTVED